MLEKKLTALKAIKDAGIPMTVSMTVVPGLNENEIKDVLELAIKNEVTFIAIRTVARVGKYYQKEKFFLSDLLNIISRQLGVKKDELIAVRERHYTPYFIYVNLFKGRGGTRIYFHNKTLLSKLNALGKFYIEVGLRRVLPLVLARLKGKKIFHNISIRIASWPDRYDIDLEESVYSKHQHLYLGNEYKELFEALILNEGL